MSSILLIPPPTVSGMKDLIRGAGYDVEYYFTVLVGGGDVEKTEFVRALAIIDTGNLDRVTCILKLQKSHAFDDASRLDVKARYDSFG